MPGTANVLVVDDEENVRTMLRHVLQSENFDVTAVGTVAEALALISQVHFDVLISDLNIGHPADGFVVVSAMRRTNPETVTFILTGYPALETALEAMRQHVNDYLIKGAPIEELVEKIKTRLASGQPRSRQEGSKRVPRVIEEHKDWVIAHWLQRVKAQKELSSIPLSEEERRDHVPGLLEEAIAHARDEFISQKRQGAAAQHGTLRYHQNYTIPMLILESRLLQNVISDCVRSNFLVLDLSNLVPDLTKMWETISVELEESVHAYTDQQVWRSQRK